ncbi:polysaccharide lyase family 1 protein [Kitasatospora atroaurantiaca]|uniref:Pectate lyase n=1 Tax=Kitasatospora atroaurantiaca TaxID=285545 RepID=A0A561EZY9_9ACTN|nr:polysaccharide lyase family 1 protein [Kitasatospora atroaurantiaca]TWE21178.1 pectate lyase [Kitasatospora atroaurantiaca]
MPIPRTFRLAAPLGSAMLTVALAAAPALATDGTQADRHRDAVGHAVLGAGDGWGSATTGTTGGSAAGTGYTRLVRTRAELVAALGGDNAGNGSDATPKIVYIEGTIDLNTDDTGRHLGCDDYAAGTGYTRDAYLAAYDPAVWGRSAEPSGPQEDARLAAQKTQARQVQISVGPNTTLVGIGHKAKLLGGGFLLKNVDNVAIRNLTFQDAADCFPQWDPTDGSTGTWNSMYDSVTLYNATHVWIDHNTFTDGGNRDAEQPLYYDRPYQVHDGQLDITNGSDYVTASWNVFRDHDKTNLVGSSNSSKVDPGHLRVTFHHNLWQNTVQRAPRVRFGQVDVYNNLYTPGAAEFEYSIGVGKSSQLVVQDNYFKLPAEIPAAKLLYNWGGTALTADGNLVNGTETDLIGAFNAANPAAPLGTSAGWTPVLRAEVSPVTALPHLVGHHAGAGRI